MKHGMFTCITLLGLCAAGIPHPAKASNFDTIPCAEGKEPGATPGLTFCRITVPNGTFAGEARPLGSETGKHGHPWPPSPTWWDLTPPGPQHDVVEHLLPWTFYGAGTPGYSRQHKPVPGVVLSGARDSIWQWLPVPVLDGTQSTATSYVVRVTYAHADGRGPANPGMTLIAADGDSAVVSEKFADTQTASPDRPATFEATITVRPYTRVTQLGVAVGNKTGETPLFLSEIAALEVTFPGANLDIDF